MLMAVFVALNFEKHSDLVCNETGLSGLAFSLFSPGKQKKELKQIP